MRDRVRAVKNAETAREPHSGGDPPGMKWVKNRADSQKVKEIAGRYGVDLITATILVRRSITSPAALLFFLENDVRFLHNPFLMQNMAEAVERIDAAVESGEGILIFGDRDVDGITSTVLLYEILKEMGAEAQWMLPEGEEAYGLSRKAIEKAVETGTGLLITVDCGISNTREIALAAELGIETIVIDHHNPPETLPAAAAIVNPKLAGSIYPFRDLCGCAVASKVEWALRFSQTPFFNVPIVLMNARPANQTVVVDAVKLVNLVETERISENIVPGIVRFEKTRLCGFIARAGGSGEILVLDARSQSRMLGKAFGGEVEISLSDLSPLVNEFLPELSDMSLLKIQQSADSGKYSERPAVEIDVLADLFRSLVLAREKPRLQSAYKRMDLVTLGTLADLMPLIDENRILVKQGLSSLLKFERNGLRQLFLRKDLLGKRIGTSEIAWQIAPLLNSAGRMGEPGKATQLFLSEAEEEIEELVDHLFALDSRRKSLGESAWAVIRELGRECFERTGGRCVLVSDPRIQRGITGIMASRLQTFFKCPAIAIAAGETAAVGSIRSAREGFIGDFFADFSGFFTNYGGHDFAGGFSLISEKLDAFLQSFFARIVERELPSKEEENITVDAEIPTAYLAPSLQKVVDLFEPCGEANPPLTFMTTGMKILHCDLIGRKALSHLKLLLGAGKLKWPAVFWNAAGRFPGDFSIGDTVDVVYRFGRNTYGGSENLQLTILDIQRCTC
jgi:single-stranded-DNA-specific exonuclease